MVKIYGGRCGSNACVEVTANENGTFTLTSTIEGNDGSVTYEPAELADFLSDVKMGKYDQLHREARNHAAAATIA